MNICLRNAPDATNKLTYKTYKVVDILQQVKQVMS